ncbi:putative mitochondrial protein [Andalucia godoyi]|uniref:Putative mitochondrial protein n=1 Tax=Andalucia godoyi TaxID=505711 RepID=A0A8K0AGX7_ANDGO|nr:putative mitochondrial protein [Andalucia godoyi]|eukprot:ANDGO_05625.mRNA.1 putative mitochondrial protein
MKRRRLAVSFSSSSSSSLNDDVDFAMNDLSFPDDSSPESDDGVLDTGSYSEEEEERLFSPNDNGNERIDSEFPDIRRPDFLELPSDFFVFPAGANIYADDDTGLHARMSRSAFGGELFSDLVGLVHSLHLTRDGYKSVTLFLKKHLPEKAKNIPMDLRSLWRRVDSVAGDLVDVENFIGCDGAYSSITASVRRWIASPIVRSELVRTTVQARPLIEKTLLSTSPPRVSSANADTDGQDTLCFADIVRYCDGVITERWQCIRFFESIWENRDRVRDTLAAVRAKLVSDSLHGLDIMPVFVSLEFFFDGLPIFRRNTSDCSTCMITCINYRFERIPDDHRGCLYDPVILVTRNRNEDIQDRPLNLDISEHAVRLIRESVNSVIRVDKGAGMAFVFMPLYFGTSADGVARNEVAGMKSIGLSLRMCSRCTFINERSSYDQRFSADSSDDVFEDFPPRLGMAELSLVRLLDDDSTTHFARTRISSQGYHFFSPLWHLTPSVLQTIGVDVFHAEGEVVVPRHLEQVEEELVASFRDRVATRGQEAKEFWIAFSNSFHRMRDKSVGCAKFASLKGWKWAANGRMKMDTMKRMPLILRDVLSPSEYSRLMGSKVGVGLRAHSCLIRCLMQKVYVLNGALSEFRAQIHRCLLEMVESVGHNLFVPTLHMFEHFADCFEYLGILSHSMTFRFERVIKKVKEAVERSNRRSVTATAMRDLHRRSLLTAFQFGDKLHDHVDDSCDTLTDELLYETGQYLLVKRKHDDTAFVVLVDKWTDRNTCQGVAFIITASYDHFLGSRLISSTETVCTADSTGSSQNKICGPAEIVRGTDPNTLVLFDYVT